MGTFCGARLEAVRPQSSSVLVLDPLCPKYLRVQHIVISATRRLPGNSLQGADSSWPSIKPVCPDPLPSWSALTVSQSREPRRAEPPVGKQPPIRIQGAVLLLITTFANRPVQAADRREDLSWDLPAC